MKNQILVFLFLLLSGSVFGQCTLSVSISQSEPTICAGNSITLSASTSGGTAPFSYIWSTGETTSSIKVNNAGNYTVTVTDKTAGCQPVKQSVNISASVTPNAPTTAGKITCSNSSVTLQATAPGGVYQWYDAPTGGNFLKTGDSFTTPALTASTTYYVQTTLGGCTSARTPVTVSITSKPTVLGASVCAGSGATLKASGGDTYTWYDAATGGNVVSNSAVFVTPPLTNTTTYYVVVVTSNGCTSARTPVVARVSAPPQPPVVNANISVCAGASANLHADSPGAIIFWYSSATSSTPLISSPDYTTPALTATTDYYVESSLNDCVSGRKKVTVKVNPLPATPAAKQYSICYGSATTLTASASPGGTYHWYDAPAGGNLLNTGNTYNTPVLTNSTSYYVEADNGSCVSGRAEIDVNIKSQVPPPSVQGAVICSGSNTVLTPTSPGGTYNWYTAASGGTPVFTGNSFTTPALTVNTIYYVDATINGCTSTRSIVSVAVLPAVAAPVAQGTSVCFGSSAALSASGAENNYEWYDQAAGGNLLSTDKVYVTPALTAGKTYYVANSNTSCSSPRTAVTVTVNPVPSTPSVINNTTCEGSPASLEAVVTDGGTVEWYDMATGGTLLQRGNIFNTPVLKTNITYYVQNVTGNCTSPRQAVTVTVNPVYKPQFQYATGTYCSSGTINPVPVINNPAGGTFSASPAGLVFVSTTTGEIDLVNSVTKNYIISFKNNGPCPETTTAILSIGVAANASFSYNGPYCQTETDPLPTFPIGSTAGTFSASPAGLVFANTSTGEIDLSASSAGTYTVTNKISPGGTCPDDIKTATVVINQKALVNAGPDQFVKAGTVVQLAGSIGGAATSATWSGGTGTFSDKNSITSTYTPGPGETSAMLALTSIDPAGPCGPQADAVVITFTNQAAAPTAAGAAICSGSFTTLLATAPGGTYSWYDAATGGNLLQQGATFITRTLTATTTYYVETTKGGVKSTRTPVVVTVNDVPQPPTVTNTSICRGSGVTLKATTTTGSLQWYDAAADGNLLSTTDTYITPPLSATTTYYVQTVSSSCASARVPLTVTVLPVANIVSKAKDVICSGDALNYTILADLPQATFLWSRAAVPGISNAAAADKTSTVIDETLINTSGNPVAVTYAIIPVVGTCPGPAFNYVVTVNSTPAVTSKKSDVICSGASDDYAITFDTPNVNFSWSRAAVPGISNISVAGQKAASINENLFNTSNDPVDVTYIINYNTSSCTAAPFNLVITVNPDAKITSSAFGQACSGYPQNYVITSNIPNTTFMWSRAAVNNISNPAVVNQTSGTIDETLINNTVGGNVNVTYMITPIANGCPGDPFKYTVTVNPQVPTPVANANSPVCIGSTIHLRTASVINATYRWTGPNGYTSALQNPDIKNVTSANAGVYTLVVTLKGCDSKPATVAVAVNDLPLANAGPDQQVCVTVSSVQLAGNVSGGTTTGIWTAVNGSGTFSPSSNVLNAQYILSANDRKAGAITLKLTSTSKDDCTISTDEMTVTFGTLPAVDAGPDQSVCFGSAVVSLNGAIKIAGGAKWSTSGTGSFSPSTTDLHASYLPSKADMTNGLVKLTLLATDAGVCDKETDEMTITFVPLPIVNAGGTKYVLQGQTVTLTPTVNEDNLKYLWSPNIGINDVTAKNPVITGDVNRVYTLTVTDATGCQAQDEAAIIVSPLIVIPNTFTPNNDGINDLWNITGLTAYRQATIDIFTRYGSKIYHAIGYDKPWDGRYNGAQLPVGTYYYVINTKFQNIVYSGYVALIR